MAYGCNTSGGATGDMDRIKYIVVTVALTAGQNPLDIGNGTDATVISYTDENVYYNDLYDNTNASLSWTGTNDGDSMLEYGEKAKITIPIWGVANDANVSSIDLNVNDRFTIEIKPTKGSVLPISRTVPSEIKKVTNLH